MPTSIEISDLCKTYGCTTAVNNLNLMAYPSQLIALLGPNGAGKTTLMNMIAGFLAPTSGQIIINGQSLAASPLQARKSIGFLPEGAPLYADMTVKSFLNYMSKLKKLPLSSVNNALLLSNLTEVANQKIDTLSKGYKRRVGFAAAILSNPDILLLDEPTDGLDPNQKAHMLGLINDMSKTKTIIISTHLLDEAETIANRIMIMHHGRILADGDLDAIKKQTNSTSLENAFIKLTR